MEVDRREKWDQHNITECDKYINCRSTALLLVLTFD